ncbi:MAG: COR domain-containing protein, partial [Bacteroidota bacterium]
NNISDAKPIAELKGLTTLYLRSNNIADATFLRNMYSLRELELDGNPIQDPPPEVMKQGLEAIQAYFAAQEATDQKDATVPLYEARVLFVGQPGAGKTSLMKKLVDPYFPIPQDNQDSTIGIDIHKGWEFPCQEAPDQTFRANFWDFGGQQIQYQLHHFFLSSRSLYVLLADDRKQDTEFDYWFDIIRQLGQDPSGEPSPVLVVLNERNSRSITNYDEGHYQHIYPKLPLHKREVDLAEAHDPQNGIINPRFEAVKQKIYDLLTNLKHVGTPLPSIWVQIRDAVETLAEEKNYINFQQYQEVCEGAGLEGEKNQLVLSQYLHDLGLMLHFQEDPSLSDFIILKPEWAVNAIYNILRDKELETNNGQFAQSWLFDRWSNTYSLTEKGNLLNLMKREKFDLIYPIKNQDNDYLVPSLMPTYDPQVDWPYQGSLRYRYQYGFMPKGLIARLIVRLGDYVHYEKKNPQIWRRGAIFEMGAALAKVEESKYQDVKGISISITGKGDERKKLLDRIRQEIPKLHQKFNKLPAKELIPCNCETCEASKKEDERSYFTIQQLESRIRNGKAEIWCEYGGRDVDISGLLESVIYIQPSQKFMEDTYQLDLFASKAYARDKSYASQTALDLPNLIQLLHKQVDLSKEAVAKIPEPKEKEEEKKLNFWQRLDTPVKVIVSIIGILATLVGSWMTYEGLILKQDKAARDEQNQIIPESPDTLAPLPVPTDSMGSS